MVSLLVRLLFSSLRLKLDEVVDSEDGDGRLGGELQRLYLRDRGFEDTGQHVVPEGAVGEIQAVVLEVLVLLVARVGLARVVIGPQLGNQVRGVLGRVDCQGLGNDEQGLGEVGDGQLLSGKRKYVAEKFLCCPYSC